MSLYRTDGDANFKNYGETAIPIVSEMEWLDELDGPARIDDPSWISRYEYEAELLTSIIINYTSIGMFHNIDVLELGSGPGLLRQKFLSKWWGSSGDLSYDLIDKQSAKDIYVKRGYDKSFKSYTDFIVADLYKDFDYKNMPLKKHKKYNLIVANDFLEHIANPSSILSSLRDITINDSLFFISVPNWRMGHEFIYRGLFDYDNFVYFCHCHGWEIVDVYESPLKCNGPGKQCYESLMPEELVNSWNWYFVAKKI